MANKHQGDGFEQHANAWYREPRFVVEQLFDLDSAPGVPMFEDALIWDPSCGSGNILDVAAGRGHPTIGSDIVNRGSRHRFYQANFLVSTKWPSGNGRRLAIVCNPPFNVPPGAALSFMLKTIEAVPYWRAAFLVPLEFLCGQTRYETLFAKHPPSHVVYCSQRPSMPPGEIAEAMIARGEDPSGGKADFVWIIWTEGGPYRTESRWLRPKKITPKSERRISRGASR